MPTLDEAVANLDEVLADAPLVARGILDITVLWQPKVDAIRTAVRDVALATEQLGQDGMRHSEILAEIKRDLGDSPHG